MRRMWIILIISELCYVPWYSLGVIGGEDFLKRKSLAFTKLRIFSRLSKRRLPTPRIIFLPLPE